MRSCVHLHFNCNVKSVQLMRPGIGQNVFCTQWVTSCLGGDVVLWLFKLTLMLTSISHVNLACCIKDLGITIRKVNYLLVFIRGPTMRLISSLLTLHMAAVLFVCVLWSESLYKLRSLGSPVVALQVCGSRDSCTESSQQCKNCSTPIMTLLRVQDTCVFPERKKRVDLGVLRVASF